MLKIKDIQAMECHPTPSTPPPTNGSRRGRRTKVRIVNPARERYYQLANDKAILKNHVEYYPPSAYEWEYAICCGIRLARHVGEWECRVCPYGIRDHSIGWAFEQNVCVKDAFKHGYKPEWSI